MKEVETVSPLSTEVSPQRYGFDTASAVCLSTYISDSCSRGRLFEQATYELKNFESFVDRFGEDSLSTLPIPPYLDRRTMIALFQKRLKEWLTKYEKMFEATDHKDRKPLKEMALRARSEGQDGFEKTIEYLKKEDHFPPILWIETGRARQAYLDSLEFMIKRIENWFRLAPKAPSDRMRRNRLVQAMIGPHLQLFKAFGESMSQFFKLLLFIEVWSCRNESELFSDRPWTFEKVDSEAFEEVYTGLHESLSILRQSYFQIAGGKLPTIEFTRPLPWAMRELAKIV